MKWLSNRHASPRLRSCSSRSSSNVPRLPNSSLHAPFRTRIVAFGVVISLGDEAGFKQGAPDLDALNRVNLTNAVLLANLMRPPGQQYQPGNLLGDTGSAGMPSVEIRVADFVHALECIVRSSGMDEVNPEQLQEILDEMLQANLMATFTPAQLTDSLKNLAVICSALPQPVMQELTKQAGSQMMELDISQLANLGWALMRLAPVADEQERKDYGINQEWLQRYHAACEQQLQQIAVQQQPLPSGQQLANLLLIPAAVNEPLSQQGMQLFEQVLVMSERRLCSMAVAQLFTCYVRLRIRPQQQALAVLLRHLEEDMLLYDYDMLTQVAVGVYALQLRLPNKVLADITDRTDMLQSSGQADPNDVQLLKAAMDRVAKAAMAVA